MPSVPNISLPPPPTGSAPAKTNAKFAHFLTLKAQGIHFNEKLASSSALKNPSLYEKLTDFAGFEQADHTMTTLSKAHWDPQAFPAWAFKSELAKMQKKIEKERKEGRKGLEFVPSSVAGENGTNKEKEMVSRQASAAERVMAGLDAGQNSTPKIQAGVKRKSRFDN